NSSSRIYATTTTIVLARHCLTARSMSILLDLFYTRSKTQFTTISSLSLRLARANSRVAISYAFSVRLIRMSYKPLKNSLLREDILTDIKRALDASNETYRNLKQIFELAETNDISIVFAPVSP